MKSKSNARLMVVAPHPDDEVLGVGGTMARFARAGGDICVLTVAAHMPPLYSKEVHEKTVAEARRAHAMIGVKESIFLDQTAVLLGSKAGMGYAESFHIIRMAVAPETFLG